MARRVCIWITGVVLLTAGYAPAQETQIEPAELNRKYQESLAQLKAAQDRKNELANENEMLKARIAELEKKLEDAKREAVTVSEKTFSLRSQFAAWDTFLIRYPVLMREWKSFIERSPLAAPTSMPDIPDPTVPLSVGGN